MRTAIHPNWNDQANVTCACGNTFKTGSTLDAIRVEICSKCHPFFTGQQKFVDTLGQVERFQRKTQVSQEKAAQKQQVIQARQSKRQSGPSDKPSLKDLLMQARKNSAS